MDPKNTVVYGEASESDSEEIPLDCEERQDYRVDSQSIDDDTKRDIRSGMTERLFSTNTSKSDVNSSIFAFPSAASLARLANYSSYNLLTSSGPFATTVVKKDPESIEIKSEVAELPILHRTLYTKNQQLSACLAHLKRHPYEKAAKDFHTISQRLVGVQKAIQDANIAVHKLKREQKNLDFEIRMLG